MQRRTLITTGLLLAALPAAAAPAPRLSDPVRAVLSPGGATLFVSETLPVETSGGVPVIRMLLPENATDFQLLVSNGVIARVSSKVVAGEDTGELAREKERMEKETASLKGELAACEAKISHASKHPEKQADFPALFVRVDQLRKRIAQLEQLVKSYPKSVPNRLLVTAALAADQPSAAVRYSYRVPDCSWSPAYQIDCAPQKDGRGILTVRLEAVVTQSSGFDWTRTEVDLITRGDGPVSPAALRDWRVGAERPKAAASGARNAAEPEDAARMAMPAMARSVRADKPRPKPVVTASTDGTYASWRPALRGLLQGESRILLDQETWTEPLVWVSRPLNRDARVFLTAEHALDAAKVWPEGRSSLSVDGIAIGSGAFAPRDGKVFLSFGEDPRVKLTAQAEPRKTGTEGFIGKDKVWEWAWKYTVRNDRANTVNLRVERPLPRSVHKDVQVEVQSAPEAVRRGNALAWEFKLPPRKTSELSHSVRVSAPEKLDIYTPSAP